MNRSVPDQDRHDGKVMQVAIAYESKGFSVWADVPGSRFSRPGMVNGSRPDVVAQRNSTVVIIEVETVSSKNSSHARKQARDFSRFAATRRTVSFKLEMA